MHFYAIQLNEGNPGNKNHHDVYKLFLLIMLIVFLTARQCHQRLSDIALRPSAARFSPVGIIKRITCFSQFELWFET